MQSLLLPAQLPADPTLADRLEDSLRGLVRAACAQQRANPLLARLLSPIIGRLNRIAARLHIIVAQFHAGTLPAPSATPRRHLPSTPPPADDAPPGDPQPGNGPTCDAQPGNGPAGHGPPARRIQALPSARAWLVKLMGWPAPCYGSHLNTMLAEPEMLALVQAAPQAGRLLRPLCRMFGIDPLPEYLRLPPRPPRRRASRRLASRTPPDNSAPAEQAAVGADAPSTCGAAAAIAGFTDRQIRLSLGLPAAAPRDAVPYGVDFPSPRPATPAPAPASPAPAPESPAQPRERWSSSVYVLKSI